MRKKRSYLLLELLISVTLLAVCAIPLLSSQPKNIATKLKIIEQIERDRIATLAMTEIVEMLEKQKIPWSQIPKVKEHGAKILMSKKPRVYYKLHTLREKAENGGKISRLVDVVIFINTSEWVFRILVSHA